MKLRDASRALEPLKVDLNSHPAPDRLSVELCGLEAVTLDGLDRFQIQSACRFSVFFTCVLFCGGSCDDDAMDGAIYFDDKLQ